MRNLSIKLKLIISFVVTIIFMLLCILFYSLYIVNIKFLDIKKNLTYNLEVLHDDINSSIKTRTDELVDAKEHEVNLVLRTASNVSKHVIRAETDNFINRMKVIAEKDDVRNAIINQMFKSGTIKQSGKEYFQEFKKSNSKFKYVYILNEQKTSAWDGQLDVGLEIFDIKGNIKARTGVKKEFRENDNSDFIQKILNIELYTGLEVFVSNKDGIGIKMYTNISDGISAQNKGGIIGTIVLGSSFADLLRDHTGLDIIIYNKDKFFSTSFFDKGKRLNFRNREDLYNKFVNKEITENFEIMKIDLSENNQFYKLYYNRL